jgi:hypothetical protein
MHEAIVVDGIFFIITTRAIHNAQLELRFVAGLGKITRLNQGYGTARGNRCRREQHFHSHHSPAWQPMTYLITRPHFRGRYWIACPGLELL